MSFKKYIEESINDKGIFKAAFIVSSPYAGKTYTISQIKGGQFPIKIITTDNATEGLSKLYNINPSIAWDYFGGDKVKRITVEELYHAINGMLPLMVESTSADPSNLFKRKGILEGLGYDISVIFINTDLETVLKRMKESNRERKVDEDVVLRIFEKVQKMKPFYKKSFENFTEINNSEGQLTDKVIMDCFVKTQKFFEAPIENPIAQSNIQKLKENNQKYLIPTAVSEEEMKKYINGWYKNN
jgi:hypothetical protein